MSTIMGGKKLSDKRVGGEAGKKFGK